MNSHSGNPSPSWSLVAAGYTKSGAVGSSRGWISCYRLEIPIDDQLGPCPNINLPIYYQWWCELDRIPQSVSCGILGRIV
jgi:hypothetical protein